MKKLKTLCMVLMAIVLSMSVVGCAGGSPAARRRGSSNATEITFLQHLGTLNPDDWLRPAIARFTELKKDEVYEEGKTGVKISVMNAKVDYGSMPDADIVIGENQVNIYDMQSKGWLMNLDSVVENVGVEKIEPAALERIKGSDGKYYGMPHFSYYTGLSYNIDLFEDNGLYFAAEGEDGYVYESGFGTAVMVSDTGVEKSLGPDGKPGTYDDGLPSSLQEFLILCDYIKKETSINPFTITGAGTQKYNYAFNVVNTIWANLAGGKAMNNVYCNWSDEPVEVIKRNGNSPVYKTEELFYTGSGIKDVETEMVVLNEENGYRIYDMAARYYALAFLNTCLSEDWFCKTDFDGGSNFAAQRHMFFGEKNDTARDNSAILVDASYWYGEARQQGTIAEHQSRFNKIPNTSVMPMPVKLTGSVTSAEEGRKPVQIDIGSSQLFATKNAESSEGKARAVKEFIEFLYSDAELALFTENTGLDIPMNYDYDRNKLNALGSFYANLQEQLGAADVIRTSSASTRFKNALGTFSLSWGGRLMALRIDEMDFSAGPLYAFTQRKTTAQVFENSLYTKAEWDAMVH